MSDRTPAEVFAPGEFISDELEARGWTQEDLARILGKPLPTINKIVNGKSAITPETAQKLGAAFGNSAQFWMNLEAAWQLHGSNADTSAVRDRAKIYDLAPIREMVRRGWIKKTSSSDELAAELRKHFGVDDLSRVPEFCAAARSATRGENGTITSEQWAWICQCRNISSLVDAARFRKSEIDAIVPSLVALANEPEEVRKLPRMLAEIGIRLVVVKQLQGTAMDGAALRRNEQEPVIGVSLRYGRLDNFWFTVLHELAHILHGDGIRADSDICLRGDLVDATEDRANKTAASWLVPQDDLDSFIRRTTPIYSSRKIANFAKRIGVHPSIVVGQLKFRGELEWDKFNGMNVDIRGFVRQASITDGWDGPAPVE